MTTIIRRFNAGGIASFSEFLSSPLYGNIPQLNDILHSTMYSESLNISTYALDSINVNCRLSAAKALKGMIDELRLSNPENDVGLWTWISAYIFERACKRSDEIGSYLPGELSLWILNPKDYKRFYRHYLCSIWQLYSRYLPDEELLYVLMKNRPINTPGELMEQVFSAQDRRNNKKLIELVGLLYWDNVVGQQKKGSAGKGAGSPRRLARVLRQFELTYDLYQISAEKLLHMLPKEFDKFK